MNKEKKILPVILCGGTGSRLWPLSRDAFPKQFCKLIKDSKLSLLQETYERIREIPNLVQPLIIANEKYRFLVSEHLKQINCIVYYWFVVTIVTGFLWETSYLVNYDNIGYNYSK